MQRLVFGDDGSEFADVAWLWINSHSWPEWQIDVVTAEPGEHAEAEPQHPRTLVPGAIAGSASHRMVSGDPRAALVTAAADADLLVVGPRGRGLMKALHIGSTAEALIQASPVPLLIPRHGRATKRVVVAADGSAHARAAETALLSLPWADQLDVLVLTVGDDQDVAPVTSAAADRAAGAVASVETQILQPGGLPIFYRARDVVLETADQWNADMVVLGSHGLTHWEAVNEFAVPRAGSTASAVAAHATCALLLA